MEKINMKTFSRSDEPSSSEGLFNNSWVVYKNLFLISFAYLFNFIAFSGLQNLQSSIHKDPSAGFVYLCVLYSSFSFSSIFLSSLFIAKVGYKYTIFVALIGYFSFTLAHFYPAYWLMVVVSLVSGISSALLWASAASYITFIAKTHAKNTGCKLETVSPKFFSIFYTGFRSSQVVGNLISSLILRRKGFLHNNGTASVDCGAQFCQSDVEVSITGQVSRSKVNTLTWMYTASGCMAILSVLFFLENIKESKREKTKRKHPTLTRLLACLRLCTEPKALLLLPLTFFIGLEHTFIYGDYTKAFVTCSVGIEKVGFVMMCFGSVSCFVAFIISLVLKRIGTFKLATIGTVLFLCLLVWCFLWNVNKMSPMHLYITATLWGLADILIMSQVHATYGVIFFTQKEEAFSLYKTIQSLGYVINFGIGNNLCIKWKLVALLIFLILGSATYTVLRFKYKVQDTDIDTKSNEADFIIEDKFPHDQT